MVLAGHCWLHGLRSIGDYLDVSEETVRSLMRDGLPVRRRGERSAHWWARTDEIDTWLGERLSRALGA